MKNMFIIKEFRRILRKQLILPLLLFAASLILLRIMPRDNYLSPRPLNSKSHFENFYNEALPCVSVTVEQLYSTGCDSVINGRVQGRYYYTLEEGFCQFYLMGTDWQRKAAEKEDAREQEGERIAVRGRLLRLSEPVYEALLEQMASELDWTVSSLRDITAPYVISALPSPLYLHVIFSLLAYGCLILSLSELACGLLYLWKPLFSPAFRYLGTPGEVRLKLPALELELKRAPLVKEGGFSLTPGHLISMEESLCLFLPLSSIRKAELAGAFLPLFSGRGQRLRIITKDGRSHAFTSKNRETLEKAFRLLNENK